MEITINDIKGYIRNDIPLISVLSNVSSVLYMMDDVSWAGFYLAKDDGLYLGPFQGEPACLYIKEGKGVCGTSMKEGKTIIVPNVHEFKGHIACSAASNSEIVTPIIKDDKVVAVIDLDSTKYDRFHEEDKEFLENIAKLLSSCF